jgi:hypothetical protein
MAGGAIVAKNGAVGLLEPEPCHAKVLSRHTQEVPMPYVKLPANISFSAPREVGKHTDAIDISVDGEVVHALKYDTSEIAGNTSEEFAIARAHVEAKDWLRSNGHLAAGE